MHSQFDQWISWILFGLVQFRLMMIKLRGRLVWFIQLHCLSQIKQNYFWSTLPTISRGKEKKTSNLCSGRERFVKNLYNSTNQYSYPIFWQNWTCTSIKRIWAGCKLWVSSVASSMHGWIPKIKCEAAATLHGTEKKTWKFAFAASVHFDKVISNI